MDQKTHTRTDGRDGQKKNWNSFHQKERKRFSYARSNKLTKLSHSSISLISLKRKEKKNYFFFLLFSSGLNNRIKMSPNKETSHEHDFVALINNSSSSISSISFSISLFTFFPFPFFRTFVCRPDFNPITRDPRPPSLSTWTRIFSVSFFFFRTDESLTET